MDFTFKLGTGILTTARAESPRNITGIFLRMASLRICKNVATEISLIRPLTESCSGACFFFFIVTFYLFNRYRIGHSR